MSMYNKINNYRDISYKQILYISKDAQIRTIWKSYMNL